LAYPAFIKIDEKLDHIRLLFGCLLPKVPYGIHAALAKLVDAHLVTCFNLLFDLILHLKALNIADLQLEDAVLFPCAIALQDLEDASASAVVADIYVTASLIV
jgi:hypothetical protein